MGPGSRFPLTNWCVVLESFSYSRRFPFNPAPPPWGHTASRTPSSARQDVLSHPCPDPPACCLIDLCLLLPRPVPSRVVPARLAWLCLSELTIETTLFPGKAGRVRPHALIEK